jgi:hypothetical protein
MEGLVTGKDSTMKIEIESCFNSNHQCVERLVALYGTVTTVPGRRAVDLSDLLRSADVFLHATLEDFLLRLLEWKLPTAEASHPKEIPITGTKPRTSITRSMKKSNAAPESWASFPTTPRSSAWWGPCCWISMSTGNWRVVACSPPRAWPPSRIWKNGLPC